MRVASACPAVPPAAIFMSRSEHSSLPLPVHSDHEDVHHFDRGVRTAVGSVALLLGAQHHAPVRNIAICVAASTQDRLDNVGRQQGQTEDATHVGLIEFLGCGDFRDGRMRAVLQHFAPTERPSDLTAEPVADHLGLDDR